NETGIVKTPFKWFNVLSEEYEIVSLQQLYRVKDKDWHRDGRYPSNIYQIRLKDIKRTEEALINLQNQKEILFAELDAVLRQGYTPDDPMLDMQWAIRAIEAQMAWDIETGSADVLIGIVDSGIKWNHPDLRENVYINTAELPGITIDWENGEIIGGDGIDNDGNGFIDDVLGWDFCHTQSGWDLTERNNPFQKKGGNQHGTHVSGCAAADGDNGIGVAGPAFHAKLINTKHSFTYESTSYIYNGYAGIYYCVDTGARIINASWGGGGDGGVPNLAVSYAKDHGTMFLTSAGNSNRDNMTYNNYPTNAVDAYSVVSSTYDDTKSGFSNYGTNAAVTAPGSSILSTYYGDMGEDSYGNLSGTSMASPTAAGVAALILSHYPTLTVDQLAHRLKTGCDPIDHLHEPYLAGKLGAGRVNPFNSLMYDKIPRVDIIEVETVHLTGDDDTLNPGETLTFKVRIKNRENWNTALPTTASISTNFGYANITANTAQYGTITSGADAISSDSFVIEIDENCPIESHIELELSYLADGGTGIVYEFKLPFVINVTGNRDGWPLPVLNTPIVSSFVFDINQDGENEIIYVTSDNRVHVITQDKDYLYGFPVQLNTLVNQPVTIIKSGELYEIVVCGGSTIHKINHLGQVTGTATVSGSIMSSVVAFDLNNNGYECMAIGTSRLYLFNNDLSVRENFPVSLGAPTSTLPVFIDFYQNNQIKLVAATNDGNVHIIDAHSGEIGANSPIYTGVMVLAGVVAAQNNDSVVLFLAGRAGTPNNVMIINSSGEILGSNTIDFPVSTLPIIVDLHNNQHLNFICVTNNGHLHVFDGHLNHLPGFPYTLPSLVNQHPVLFDINNDGTLEVIICLSNGMIYAVSPNATVVEGFPYIFETEWKTSPILMDISGNNRLDMLLTNSLNLYYLALGLPYHETPYPVHAYSRTRNAVYSFDFVADEDQLIPEKNTFMFYNYPNPFNPTTTIVFDSKNKTFQKASIDIFNIKGQLVYTKALNTSDIKNGYIEWNADNQTTGIYFYRLSIDNKPISIKKAVLLK
ncbi:MAG: S8 family serine peptidase, partial [Candidatus Cloacimonetes bacterium]|nr:S8 family serine peptidase [Candidatus Cloacimonadota bacterium]